MRKFNRKEFFFELLSGRNSKAVNLFAWFSGMVCPSKRYSSWINQEKPRICNLVKNNLIYGCIFFLLARGTVGVLFSTSWRNIYWFLMVVTGSKCLVDIWKRVHKKSEASDAFSSWCFFGLNEVVFSHVCCLFHQIPHVLEIFLLSMGLKAPIRLSIDIVWSVGAHKEAISGFERWKFVPYVEI